MQEAAARPHWSSASMSPEDSDSFGEGYTQEQVQRHAQSILQRLAEIRHRQEALSRMHAEFTQVASLLGSSPSLFEDETSSHPTPNALASYQCKLSDRISHPVNVPLGTQAFMHGRIVHGGEVTMLLGEGYFARMSATQAAAVLQRRTTLLNERRAALEAQRQELLRRAGVSQDVFQTDDGTVEIKEPFDEEADKEEQARRLATVRREGEDEAWLAKFSDMDMPLNRPRSFKSAAKEGTAPESALPAATAAASVPSRPSTVMPRSPAELSAMLPSLQHSSVAAPGPSSSSSSFSVASTASSSSSSSSGAVAASVSQVNTALSKAVKPKKKVHFDATAKSESAGQPTASVLSGAVVEDVVVEDEVIADGFLQDDVFEDDVQEDEIGAFDQQNARDGIGMSTNSSPNVQPSAAAATEKPAMSMFMRRRLGLPDE
eukprot:CAMPEP_0177641724 /NCGR_PEP_ID=MMETSP0447-20121125/7214_1 /TAXON_ID=0 /ORGANISM="Stygamoeba regulata, Strain BSH-02190019" /LENGTH=431 /DNA_ID=CAMNT_0019143851 /DNA_START=16 /DNA_END=1311 /DNA_ORIENTATION=+